MTLIAVDEGAANLGFYVVACVLDENGQPDVTADAVPQVNVARADLPAADPHLLGALWNNGTAIVVSAG